MPKECFEASVIAISQNRFIEKDFPLEDVEVPVQQIKSLGAPPLQTKQQVSDITSLQTLVAP